MITFRRLTAVIAIVLILCVVVSTSPIPQDNDESSDEGNRGGGMGGGLGDILTGIPILEPILSALIGILAGLPILGDLVGSIGLGDTTAVLHNDINPRLAQAANVLSSHPNTRLTDSEKVTYTSQMITIVQHMDQPCSAVENQSGTQPLKGEFDTADGHMFTLVTGMGRASGVEAKRFAPDNAQLLVKCYPKTASLFGLD